MNQKNTNATDDAQTTIDTAADLISAIKDGADVSTYTPLVRGEFTVVDTITDEDSIVLDRSDLRDPDGKGYRAIEHDTGDEWVLWIMPNRGGPNNGVVAMFWTDQDDGGVLGHHEIYPRAFEVSR